MFWSRRSTPRARDIENYIPLRWNLINTLEGANKNNLIWQKTITYQSECWPNIVLQILGPWVQYLKLLRFEVQDAHIPMHILVVYREEYLHINIIIELIHVFIKIINFEKKIIIYIPDHDKKIIFLHDMWFSLCQVGHKYWCWRYQVSLFWGGHIL
jgi:hypothetical protein